MQRSAESFFNVLNDQDTLELVCANKLAVERQMEQTQQHLEVGLTAITDVNETQAEHDQALAEEIVAAITLANSEPLHELICIDYRELDVFNTTRFNEIASSLNSGPWLQTTTEHDRPLQSAHIAKDHIGLAETGHESTMVLVACIGSLINRSQLY